MRVASAKLEAANSIMQAQVEMAQKEFDSAQGTANAFLRYCGNELEVTFDDGLWGFDEQLMCFVRKEASLQDMAGGEPDSEGTPPVSGQPLQGGPATASSQQPMNGVVEHAANTA
jgi:hypothetical protein